MLVVGILLAAVLTSLRAADPATPRVDRFGQSTTVEFASKIKNTRELLADRAEEERTQLRMAPDRDRFGGWADSAASFGVEETGFFHVAQIGGRWAMVDPDGNVFFHLGVSGIGSRDDATLVAGREHEFEWLPPREGEFATAWHPEEPGVFSFYIANWIRKYERPFTFDEWNAQIAARLWAWGFNAVGAFSTRSAAMEGAGFPYVAHLLHDGLAFLPDRLGAGRVFDPFHPENEERLHVAFAQHVAPRANDPLLIGYYLSNEQHFELLPRLLPAYKASQVAAKAVFVERLARKYGTIQAFNSAWAGPAFANFDELKEAALAVRTDAAAADALAFYAEFLECYFGMLARVYRKYDRHHLLLGSRLTPATASNEILVRTLARHVDVMSVNYYAYAIDAVFLERIHRWSGGKPLILSEWYFSSPTEGLSSSKGVRDQRERGLAYRNYVEQGAALPFVVGTEWFIYNDQALTGRHFEGFNGEGNNTGLVNVADRPYRELVSAAAETHARIYPVMFGREQPFRFDDPRFVARAGGVKEVAVPRAPAGFALDGTTRAWPGRPAEPIEPAQLSHGVPDEKLRADFRLCWDDGFLYLHAQVKDATPMRNDRAPRAFWMGDCVEVYLGTQQLDQGGTPLFSDRHLLVSPSAGRAHVINDPAMGERCVVMASKEVSNDGYVLQLAIPWELVGGKPSTGQVLLFDLAIDNSDDGKMRRQQLMWNGSAKNAGDRGLWGRARLIAN
jgi:hypothetical protein